MPNNPAAGADTPLAAYPPPQMLITLSGPHFLLEATDPHASAPPIDARDTEGLLAAVGRWALTVRDGRVVAAEGSTHA